MAAGSNLILFITGNGSITNFPFVPTLKFVTTTGRFELLANEMDVNAGRYNDGMEMDALGAETFELALDIASGQRSKGELAGHAQVSVWRDWPRTGTEGLEEIAGQPVPEGHPLTVRDAPPLDLAFDAVVTEEGIASDQIALVMPTSLCSGQVARLIAEELDANPPPWSDVSRFVALVHTEGCGSGQRRRALSRHAHRPSRASERAPRGPAGARLRDDPQRRGAEPSRRAGRCGGPLRLGERAAGRRNRQRAREGDPAAGRNGGGPRWARRRRAGCARLREAARGRGRDTRGPRRTRAVGARDGGGVRPARRGPCLGRRNRGRARQQRLAGQRRVPAGRVPGGRGALRLARLRPAGGGRRVPRHGDPDGESGGSVRGAGRDRGRPDALPHRADPASGASPCFPSSR